jgi:hypothetical protein
MAYKIKSYKGWKIKKVKVKKTPYAIRGIEWKAEKKGDSTTQPTLSSLKLAIKLKEE